MLFAEACRNETITQKEKGSQLANKAKPMLGFCSDAISDYQTPANDPNQTKFLAPKRKLSLSKQSHIQTIKQNLSADEPPHSFSNQSQSSLGFSQALQCEMTPITEEAASSYFTCSTNYSRSRRESGLGFVPDFDSIERQNCSHGSVASLFRAPRTHRRPELGFSGP